MHRPTARFHSNASRRRSQPSQRGRATRFAAEALMLSSSRGNTRAKNSGDTGQGLGSPGWRRRRTPAAALQASEGADRDGTHQCDQTTQSISD